MAERIEHMSWNKIAVVTGASRGIGRAIARRLASEDIHVIINYSGSKQAAEETRSLISGDGNSAEIYQCNVADPVQVNQMIDEIIKKFGQIDILVNNAGITRDNLMIRMSEQDFDEVINVNLKGAFYTSKAAVKYMMKKRYGKIVNISSIVGLIGNAGQVNYSASKAGLLGLTKSLAREIASRGITVNAVAPGFIETEMTNKLSEDQKAGMYEAIPLKRFGRPEDIAEAVAFLVSDKAAYITGQVVEVNGGMNM